MAVTQGRVARDSGVLAVGSLLNGLLAYVFFATVTRALGAEAAAPVSVLWAYWSFAAAALAFPLQHWAARSVTATGSALGPSSTKTKPVAADRRPTASATRRSPPAGACPTVT